MLAAAPSTRPISSTYFSSPPHFTGLVYHGRCHGRLKADTPSGYPPRRFSRATGVDCRHLRRRRRDHSRAAAAAYVADITVRRSQTAPATCRAATRRNRGRGQDPGNILDLLVVLASLASFWRRSFPGIAAVHLFRTVRYARTPKAGQRACRKGHAPRLYTRRPLLPPPPPGDSGARQAASLRSKGGEAEGLSAGASGDSSLPSQNPTWQASFPSHWGGGFRHGRVLRLLRRLGCVRAEGTRTRSNRTIGGARPGCPADFSALPCCRPAACLSPFYARLQPPTAFSGRASSRPSRAPSLPSPSSPGPPPSAIPCTPSSPGSGCAPCTALGHLAASRAPPCIRPVSSKESSGRGNAAYRRSRTCRPQPPHSPLHALPTSAYHRPYDWSSEGRRGAPAPRRSP